jgi:hypothetical protein
MPSLVPAIHVSLFAIVKTWMAGTSPAMTVEKIALIRLPDRHPVRKSWPVALRE